MLLLSRSIKPVSSSSQTILHLTESHQRHSTTPHHTALHLPQAKTISSESMIETTNSTKRSRFRRALSWAWVALGCGSNRSKKSPSNNGNLNKEAKGGSIPQRVPDASRAQGRQEDRQPRFEESCTLKKQSEKEKPVESAKMSMGDRAKGRGRDAKTPLKPVTEGKKRHAREKKSERAKTLDSGKVRKETRARMQNRVIQELPKPADERRKRHAHRKRPAYKPKMSISAAHEIMEKAIGLQCPAMMEQQMRYQKALDKLSGNDPDSKLGSPAGVGSSKMPCAGGDISKEGYGVDAEGTLAELDGNRKLKSRSVLGLSGVTLLG